MEISATNIEGKGVENLINAIYRQAVLDYETAIIKCDKNQIEALERFFASGAYFQDAGFWTSTAKRIRQEIKIADDYIEAFLNSGNAKQEINEKLVVSRIVKKLCLWEWHNKCVCKAIKKPKQETKVLHLVRKNVTKTNKVV